MYLNKFNQKLEKKFEVSFHNLLRFECHSVLQTLSKNKFIDEVQHGADCMLSRITLCSRWEMNLQWSIAKRFIYCNVVLHLNA